MSENLRKIITGAQKTKAALAAKGTRTINEITQEFGVHPTQVNQLKKELLENAGSLFDGKRGPKSVNAQSDQTDCTQRLGNSTWNCTGLKKSGISL